MDLKVCDDLLDLSGDLYLCMEGLSLFLILRVDFVPGPALASTTCKVKSTLYTIYHKPTYILGNMEPVNCKFVYELVFNSLHGMHVG